MKTIRTVAEMQAHSRDARAAGRTIGLVPTMGAFHGGHESLMRAARAGSDELVVSLFVNPAQFNDPRDLEAYPRDERRDAAIAERLGVDVLFAPPAEAVYPAGFATTVSVPGLSDVLEGAQRGPGHFAGVSTVVAKLFNMVAPDVALLRPEGRPAGRRHPADGPRPRLPRRGSRSLPTIREPDGLAMSSRNVRLSPEERRRAAGLQRRPAGRGRGEATSDPLAAGPRRPGRARDHARVPRHGRSRHLPGTRSTRSSSPRPSATPA